MNFSTVPPYPLDKPGARLEIARQKLPDLFGVAGLGERREPDKVAKRIETRRRSETSSTDAAAGTEAAQLTPQASQKRCPGPTAAPHAG
jgi:hypothetical protein